MAEARPCISHYRPLAIIRWTTKFRVPDDAHHNARHSAGSAVRLQVCNNTESIA